MHEAMLLRECEFEGEPLPVYAVGGVPHWVAKQVGAALGYGKDGGELVGMISGEWRGEFTDADRCVLGGRKLRDFKGLIELDGDSPFSQHTRHLMLLTESGVTLASVLSRKPAGVRMRRWLVTEVLPQIVRDGHFAHDRKVVDGQLVGGDSLALARVGVQQVRAESDHLRAQASLIRAEAMQCNAITRKRQSEARAHEHAGRAQLQAGLISQVEFSAVMVHAAELVAGGGIKKLQGNDPHGPWLRARELSRRWGIHENTIGKAAKALGLRGNIDGLVREVMARRQNTTGSVVTHEYSAKAQAQIRAYLDGSRSGQAELPIN